MELVVSQASKNEAISYLSTLVGIPPNGAINDVTIAALFRIYAVKLSPCSKKQLISNVLRILSPLKLVDQNDIDQIFDKMLNIGDLVNISDIELLGSDGKSSWVYPSPPSFVRRKNGTFLLLGSSVDGTTSFTPSLLQNVQFDGCKRIYADYSKSVDDVEALLLSLGLIKISESKWAHLPKKESFESVCSKIRSELKQLQESGPIEGLKILDRDLPNTNYKSRWCNPDNGHSGIYIARRPQSYGSELWGIVQMSNGRPLKFLDLPCKRFKSSGDRACDIAWHLQMALDAESKNNQIYTLDVRSNGVLIKFCSPLPRWAYRYLELSGKWVSVYSLLVPREEISVHEDFLKYYMWLKISA